MSRRLLHLSLLACAVLTVSTVSSVAAFGDDEDDDLTTMPNSGWGGALVTQYPPDPRWRQVVIRDEAAQYLFNSLFAAPTRVVERANGTTFLVRISTSFGCSVSVDGDADPVYACVTYVRPDGSSSNGIIDPQSEGQARIGVSN